MKIILLTLVALPFAVLAQDAPAEPSKLAAVFDGLKYLYANYGQLIVGLNALLGVAIGLALIIPGEQPEKFLKSVAKFLSKFSKK